MSKFKNLMRNEFTKQYKKISIVVLTALLLLFAVCMPFLFKYMENREFSSNYHLDNYRHQISFYESEISSLKSKTDNLSKLNLKFNELNVKYNNFLIDNDISYGNWRSEVAEAAFTKENMAFAINALIEKHSVNDITKFVYLAQPEELMELSQLSNEELKAKKSEFEKDSNRLYENVKNNDYKSYLKTSADSYNKTLGDLKTSLKSAEDELKKDPKNSSLARNVETTKNQVSMQEELIKIIKFRQDHDVSPDRNDWRDATLSNIVYCLSTKYELPALEEEFKNNYAYEIQNGLTYEKYLENHKNRVQKNKEQIELNWYSLNNNMPQLGFAKDAKNTINSIYIIYVSAVVFLCVMIAGNIVSSEYSKGTIRLLILRPVCRWKLLLSKLLLVLLSGYVLLFSCVALTTLSSGIAYGFNSLSTPILSYANNAIVEQSFFSYFMPTLLFASISLIFAISLSFAISTIVKNTALAVGGTMFLYLAGLTISIFMAQFKVTWIAYTPLPYINLSSVLPGSHTVSSFAQSYGIDLLPNVGAIELVVLSIIFILTSFIVFNKQDVKN